MDYTISELIKKINQILLAHPEKVRKIYWFIVGFTGGAANE